MTGFRTAALVALVVVLCADDRPGRLASLRGGGLPAASPAVLRPQRRTASGIAAGVGMWLLVGGPAGLVIGAVSGVVAYRAVSAADRAGARVREAQVSRGLPIVCDLLAACLAAGAAPSTALEEVADAVSGHLGSVLAGVARGCRLGLSVDDAWAPYLADGPIALRTLASALARSADSGASPARTLDALSGELRDQRRTRGEAAARRAGVAMVAPLGLCFLPAFILVGVVPFIAGLVGDGLLLAG